MALERCLAAYKPSKATERTIEFIALTKAFEVCLEHGWKMLKSIIEERGLEAYAPKDVIRTAGEVGLISEVVVWIDAINARSLSVHDYFSLSEKDFVGLIRRIVKVVREL